MNVVLVGPSAARAHMRSHIGGVLTVIAEYSQLADATAADLGADAIVLCHGAGDNNGIAEPLTHREIQVLELLAEGLPNKAIAVRLAISDQTVKFHVAAILGKLGAANRTDAVRLAVRRGLIAL